MRAWVILLAAMACTDDDKEDLKVELCNGVDDDADGETDEGFGDDDADGVANCVDDSCAVDIPAAGTAEVATDCADGTRDFWIDIETEWEYRDTRGGVRSKPAVGQLTDDNNDGVIDSEDTPDVAFVTTGHQLILVSGDTGDTIFALDDYFEFADVLIADVNADGTPELVAMTGTFEIVALDGAGSTIWSSESFDYADDTIANGVVADIDGDGMPEVLMKDVVVSGEDGATLMELDEQEVLYPYFGPAIADLDRDGQQEIVIGENVYDSEGDILWSAPVDEEEHIYYISAVLNADDDEEGEVLMVSYLDAILYDTDGEALTTLTSGLAIGGTPCVADFDGDGISEIGLPDYYGVRVVEMDGTELWSDTDTSGAYLLKGCSAFDFEGDGDADLIFSSELYFTIYDGTTGVVLFQDEDWAANGLMEYPLVADVDNDGSAEIIVASSGSEDLAQGHDGISSFGHPSRLWADAGGSWPSFDYRVENVNDDGTVPAEPGGWDTYNVSRSRPATSVPTVTDLAVAYVNHCVTSCPAGNATIVFQVWNQGAEDAQAGVPVTLYAVDGEDLYAMETKTLPAIPSGTLLEGQSFEIAASTFGPDGLLIRLDDDGEGGTTLGDCDRTNNVTTYKAALCE